MEVAPKDEVAHRGLTLLLTIAVVALAAVVGGAVSVSGQMTKYRYDFWDGVLTLVARDKSKFAPEFSEEAFDEVQLGDSMPRIYELLGKPKNHLVEVRKGAVISTLYYTTIPRISSIPGSIWDRKFDGYHLRVIVFENGDVTQLTREFHME